MCRVYNSQHGKVILPKQEALPGEEGGVGGGGGTGSSEMSRFCDFLVLHLNFTPLLKIHSTLLLFFVICFECCHYFLACVACRNLNIKKTLGMQNSKLLSCSEVR